MKAVSLYAFFLMAVILLSKNTYALDMQVLQEQCADIGFKIKTPANGKCVLQLIQTVKNREANEAAQQRAYENQRAAQEADRQFTIRQQQQQSALLQQQTEMFELQKRSVAAQEQAAQAQTDTADGLRRDRSLRLMRSGLNALK